MVPASADGSDLERQLKRSHRALKATRIADDDRRRANAVCEKLGDDFGPDARGVAHGDG